MYALTGKDTMDRLMEKLKPYMEKLVNRETITYIVAGVLTTVVNFFAYHIFCNVMGIENLIANGIAWVVAVSFAYLINDLWVFQAKTVGFWDELVKISKFLGARILSFVIEESGMFLFVDVMKFNNLMVKAVLAVIVIILNYLFSKMFIFIKKEA
jgi:Predicted membrane protein